MKKKKEMPESRLQQEEGQALDELDYALLKLLQEEIPLIPRPYQMLAEQYHVNEEDILEHMKALQERGMVRRIGAVLRHQKAGYTVNALTAWNADPRPGETRGQALDRIGKQLAAQPYVSHCYARQAPPGWDWPVFAMVHAQSEDDLQGCICQMMKSVQSGDVRILKTVREWKKTSMKYF